MCLIPIQLFAASRYRASIAVNLIRVFILKRIPIPLVLRHNGGVCIVLSGIPVDKLQLRDGANLVSVAVGAGFDVTCFCRFALYFGAIETHRVCKERVDGVGVYGSIRSVAVIQLPYAVCFVIDQIHFVFAGLKGDKRIAGHLLTECFAGFCIFCNAHEVFIEVCST